MVDVTKENFNDLCPEIIEAIKSAAFVALDAEFTGLPDTNTFTAKLYDDAAQRYDKLRIGLQRQTICQLGLAIFQGVPNVNGYSVKTYNFYLRPHSCLSHDETFACQTSALEFLQTYKFDFNKWLYEGIPFLNTDQEHELRQEFKLIMNGDKVQRTPHDVSDLLSDVEVWLQSASYGDTKACKSLLSFTSQLLFIHTVRRQYSTLWAKLDQHGQIVVTKVKQAEHRNLESKDSNYEQFIETWIDKTLGFTSIFRCLTEHHKPLILHNGMLDLILLYKQFYRHLPQNYEMFKKDIHKMFPLIYDTKFLANELKFYFREKDEKAVEILSNSNLGKLATSLQQELPVLYRPKIQPEKQNDKYDMNTPRYHEAGYDAYLTGFCYLSLSHLFAMLSMDSRNQHRPLSPREHVFALKKMGNCIPLPRAAIPFLVLGGEDPISKRPPWLVFELIKSEKTLTPTFLSNKLSQFGDFDILPRNKKSVFVAASSWNNVRDMMRIFRNSKTIQVSRYNPLRHNTFIRTLSLSGVLASTGLSVWLVYNTLRKTST